MSSDDVYSKGISHAEQIIDTVEEKKTLWCKERSSKQALSGWADLFFVKMGLIK
jgi:hypothetical protein